MPVEATLTGSGVQPESGVQHATLLLLLEVLSPDEIFTDLIDLLRRVRSAERCGAQYALSLASQTVLNAVFTKIYGRRTLSDFQFILSGSCLFRDHSGLLSAPLSRSWRQDGRRQIPSRLPWQIGTHSSLFPGGALTPPPLQVKEYAAEKPDQTWERCCLDQRGPDPALGGRAPWPHLRCVRSPQYYARPKAL